MASEFQKLKVNSLPLQLTANFSEKYQVLDT